MSLAGGWDYHSLPTLNAALNGSAGVLLIIGYGFIRRRKVNAHYRTMVAAFTMSVLFLISYVTYHGLLAAHHEGVLHYPRAGALRTIYRSILFTHTVLAATVPVLAVVTLLRGFKAKSQWRGMKSEAEGGAAENRLGVFARHRAIARWTLPIWLYVSVTGVVVYFMLYHA